MTAGGARDLAWRRAGATVVDYGLVGLWVAGLAGLVVGSGAHRTVPSLSPVAGQLLGLATVTAPATVAIAAAEARGGSPGKRLFGLRLESTDAGRPMSFQRALGRSLAKVALPWELAHAGVWQLSAGGGQALGGGAVTAAYVALGVAAVGVVRGRPWYDRVSGTRVVGRDRTADPRPAVDHDA